jgi:hypothetical protein
MRPFELQRAWPIAGLLLARGCQGDHLLNPVNPPSVTPGLDAIAVRLVLDVEHGTVQVLPAPSGTAVTPAVPTSRSWEPARWPSRRATWYGQLRSTTR